MLTVAGTSQEGEASTRDRLLAAAKRLLARDGLAVRVVDIVELAKANIAAINYHFGNKDKLLQFVLETACTEVVQERLRLLEEIENGKQVSQVREVIAIWLAPALRKVCDGDDEGAFLAQLTRIVAESRTEGHIGRGAARLLFDCNEKFVDALTNLRPDLTRETLDWRMAGMIGTLVFVAEKPWFMSRRLSADEKFKRSMSEVLAFLVAGFDAPSPEFATRSATHRGLEKLPGPDVTAQPSNVPKKVRAKRK
jgi:AcrR family transcriptional regulator